MVRNLAAQVSSRYNGVAAFNYSQYNTSVYTVPATTPRADVVWDNCQNKSYTPSQLYSGRAHFKSVPIPANAVPATGADGELSIWSPSTDQFWEFWKAKRVNGQWHACWGGRIDHASTSAGYFADGMGASATGLAVAAGSIGIRELQKGRITHAMNLLVVNAAAYYHYSYPAQRSDGWDPSNNPDAVPEGIRFRLDPRVNISQLHLTRIGRIVARAAKTYGFIVTDKGGAVAVQAESGTSLAHARGRNPWGRLLGGTPGYDVLRNFPWKRLQALPMDYGKP
ncbi:DUF4124 domain-containing protein [Nocardioides mangrovicus]|nr:DUF4124 domain-containing protein [Nocardioides mangrovicus]